jgi:DNA recombination protein RmuC
MQDLPLMLITTVASVAAALGAIISISILIARSGEAGRAARLESDMLRAALAVLDQGIRREITTAAQGLQQTQSQELDRTGRALGEAVERALRHLGEHQALRLEAVEKTVSGGHAGMQAVLDVFKLQVTDALEAQRVAMDATMAGFAGRLSDLRSALNEEQERLRTMVADRLDRMQLGNEAKLEEIRRAVDEKLQTALERQLRDSFTNLQEQLAAVQQAIGQVQSVAGEVGDLKRLFSNVKSRGGWGEAQLEAMLVDILPAGTFEKNFRVRESSAEAVEFALRVPGRGEEPTWLAIDSKFPAEDYTRLVVANEAGNRDEEARARAGLEKAIRVQARKIGEKYIDTPRTLDFAILYLPSDSLFAEIARVPGLIEALRHEFHVMLAGPSLLPAFLHSFRVGHASIQLERKAVEIGETLGAVKVEWGRFGESLTAIKKQAETLSRGIDTTLVRQRAIGRRLRSVDAIEGERAGVVLALEDLGEE